MKTGIALKMKNFGKDRDTRKHETIKRVFRAYQNAHPLVIIDFEWAEYNLIPLELNRLLEDLECEIHNQYRLYVTLASRSNDYDTRTKLGKRHIRALIHLLEQYHDHFGVCLVVGNPAFLSPYEQQKSLKNSLNALTKFVVQRTDQPILIGTEGVQNIVATLGESYNVIPFFLLTDNLPNRIESYRAIAGNTPYTAVYAPYAYNKSKEWTINALWGYINRRKTTKQALKKEKIPIELIDAGPEQALASSHKDQIMQIMGEAAESLCIFGGRERFQQSAKNAKKMGVTHLIGYPLIDSWEQYAEMAETFHPTH